MFCFSFCSTNWPQLNQDHNDSNGSGTSRHAFSISHLVKIEYKTELIMNAGFFLQVNFIYKFFLQPWVYVQQEQKQGNLYDIVPVKKKGK